MSKVRIFYVYFFSLFVIFLVCDEKFVNILRESCKKKHNESLNQFIESLNIILL